MTKGSQRLTFGLRLRKRHFLEKKKLRESDGFLQGFLSGLKQSQASSQKKRAFPNVVPIFGLS